MVRPVREAREVREVTRVADMQKVGQMMIAVEIWRER